MDIRDAICWLLEEQKNASDAIKENYEHVTMWLAELSNIKSITDGRFDLMCEHDLSILDPFISALHQNRVWVLPCCPGDNVFCIVWEDKTPKIYIRPFKVEWTFDYGRTVFLDFDSAKAALDALERKQSEKE